MTMTTNVTLQPETVYDHRLLHDPETLDATWLPAAVMVTIGVGSAALNVHASDSEELRRAAAELMAAADDYEAAQREVSA